MARCAQGCGCPVAAMSCAGAAAAACSLCQLPTGTCRLISGKEGARRGPTLRGRDREFLLAVWARESRGRRLIRHRAATERHCETWSALRDLSLRGAGERDGACSLLRNSLRGSGVVTFWAVLSGSGDCRNCTPAP